MFKLVSTAGPLWVIGYFLIPGAVPRASADECRAVQRQIEAPGRYCLKSDLAIPNGVTILSDDVELDLGGHCLRGLGDPQSRSVGVTIRTGIKRISIQSGCITGYMIGIHAETGSREVTISGLMIDDSTFRGALLDADAAVFTGNIVSRVGGTTAYDNASTMGVEVRGSDCRIQDNLISGIIPTGVGDSVGIAVSQSSCTLTENVIVNRTRPEWGRTYGITAASDVTLRRNVSVGQTHGFSLPFLKQVEGSNVAYTEACGIDSADCPDVVSHALARMDLSVPPSIFAVGRAYHRSQDYRTAAIYYLAAAKLGIAEGTRIVERHLREGYITRTDGTLADTKSETLLATGKLP